MEYVSWPPLFEGTKDAARSIFEVSELLAMAESRAQTKQGLVKKDLTLY